MAGSGLSGWCAATLRLAVLCAVCLGGGMALAQGGGIVVINPERLIDETVYGRRLQSEFEAEARSLAAENRSIEAELLAEEQELTERRAGMEPADFRVLADAFDAKVEDIRREQDSKAEALRGLQESNQQEFLTTVQPVLGVILRESGAAAMLDRRGVFLSSQGVDVTDRAIARINAVLGDGRQAGKAPEAPGEPPAEAGGAEAPQAGEGAEETTQAP